MQERTPAELVALIEADGKALGFPVVDLCRRAKISRATWQRIKGGASEPKLSTWKRLQALAAALEAEKQGAKK
jgi:predicted transcriptional regulator